MKKLLSRAAFFGLSKQKLSFSREGLTRYLKNAQWMTISRVTMMVFSFITTTVVARIFGPEKFGLFSYILSAVGLFGVIAGLGIDNVVYKEITARKDERETILGTGMLLRLLTGLFAALCVFAYAFFSNETAYIKGLIITCSLVFITQPLLLLTYDFLKDAESKYVAIAQATTTIVASVAKIIVAYFSGSVFLILLILILENMVTGIVLWFCITKIKKRTLLFNFSKKYMFTLLQFSLPLTLYAASDALYSKIDQVMLRHYLDLESVGVYSAAVRLTEIWYFIPNIIIGALFPAFIHAMNNKGEYEKRMRITFFLLLGIALGISLGTLLFGKIAIGIIFGAGFAKAVPILYIYIFSLAGSYLSFLIYQDLFIKSRLYVIVAISSITALSNIVLNYFWIPTMGTKGAALATLVSYSLIPVLYWAHNKYEHTP